MALSRRGSNVLRLVSAPYYQGGAECAVSPRTPSNPDGFINLRLAETTLTTDLLRDKLSTSHRQMADRAAIGALKYGYADPGTRAGFLTALAAYFSKVLRTTVEPGNVVLGSGATATVEHAIFSLLEPGDGLLVPTPLYPGFFPDLQARTGAEFVHVNRNSNDSFKLSAEAIDAAVAEASSRGVRSKAILLTSPCNPTARLIEPAILREVLDVAALHDLHVVCDEIYAGSVFCESRTPYASLLSVATPDERQRVHVVTGLSKDFPFPALRIGCLISANDDVRAVASALGRFSGISADTMELLAPMFEDEAFVDMYVRVNRERLAQRHAWFRSQLSITLGLGGSPKSEAGVFAWIDLRKFLEATSFEAEEKLWRRILERARVNLTRGGGCASSEPGWFRLCICDKDEETLVEALRRIQQEFAKDVQD